VRRRLLIVVTLAAVIGLATAFLVYQTIIQRVAVYGQPVEQIVVAQVNVPVGEAITPQHVRLSSWPNQAVPGGALRSLAEAEGQVARSSIVAGEPLLKTKLIDAASAARGGLLPMLVPEGLRGVTIKVDEAVQETGFILPHSRVDLIASMRSEGSQIDHVGKVILQNVPVLAAGQTVEMRDNSPVKVTTVTLALTPEQVERLALAQTETRGKVILATRNLRDDRIVATAGVTKARLLGSEQPKKATSLQAQVSDGAERSVLKGETHTVSVVRAGQASEQTFVRDAGGLWAPVNTR